MICKCGAETGADWKTLCIRCWRSRPPEEVRAQRQAKLDRKIERLEAKANRLDQVGEQKTAVMDQYHGDVAFFTQPNINSAGGRSFTRQRERIINRYMAGAQMHAEANESREKADWLRRSGVAVKGDAEARRVKEREALDKILTVGSRVNDYSLGAGVITKVHKISYRVKYDRGFEYSRDKTYLRPEVAVA